MRLSPTAARRLDRFFLQALTYRAPMQVSEVLLTCTTSFPICPRCDSTLEREYMRYCDRCGQHLAWDRLSDAAIRPAPGAEAEL